MMRMMVGLFMDLLGTVCTLYLVGNYLLVNSSRSIIGHRYRHIFDRVMTPIFIVMSVSWSVMEQWESVSWWSFSSFQTLESVIVPDFTLVEFKEIIESLLNFSIISDVDDNNDFDYNNNSVDCEMDSLEHLISSLTSTVSSFFNVKAQTVSSTVFSTTVQTSSTTSPYFCQISNYNFFQDPNHNTITKSPSTMSTLLYQIYRQNFYHWSVLQLQQILLYY